MTHATAIGGPFARIAECATSSHPLATRKLDEPVGQRHWLSVLYDFLKED